MAIEASLLPGVRALTMFATAALLAVSTSSTLLSAPRHEAVTVEARASEAPVMPQSLGYLEFDLSTASGGVPGFSPLSSNSAAH